jgi:hypothetical protein
VALQHRIATPTHLCHRQHHQRRSVAAACPPTTTDCHCTPCLLCLPCSIALLYWSVFFVAVSYHIKWLKFTGKRNDVLGW